MASGNKGGSVVYPIMMRVYVPDSRKRKNDGGMMRSDVHATTPEPKAFKMVAAHDQSFCVVGYRMYVQGSPYTVVAALPVSNMRQGVWGINSHGIHASRTIHTVCPVRGDPNPSISMKSIKMEWFRPLYTVRMSSHVKDGSAALRTRSCVDSQHRSIDN